MKKLLVKCTSCKKSFNYYDSEFRPFCSEKCKNVDLNMWFDEEYTVPSQEIPHELLVEDGESYEH